MSEVTVTDRVDRTDEVRKAMRDIKAEGIKVGVLSDAGEKQQIKASVHEFGARIDVTPDMRDFFLAVGFPLKDETDEIVIPERRFLRAALDNNEDFISKRFEGYALQVVAGRLSGEKVLRKLGEDIVTLIQQQMGENGPPLSGMTTALRTGGGGATPLQDTGSLKNAITWEAL